MLRHNWNNLIQLWLRLQNAGPFQKHAFLALNVRFNLKTYALKSTFLEKQNMASFKIVKCIKNIELKSLAK